MAPGNEKEGADFFEELPFDPVAAASGASRRTAAVPKRKAGFYLSQELLDRFTRKFHELKLAGVPIENKSALVELAIGFALDDIDRGDESRLLERI